MKLDLIKNIYYFIKNIWNFRKEMWLFRERDYTFNVRLFRKSLELSMKNMELNSSKFEPEKREILYYMRKTIYLLKNIDSGKYLQKAEDMVGHKFSVIPISKTGNFEFKESIKINHDIIRIKSKIEKHEYRKLLRILFNEYHGIKTWWY